MDERRRYRACRPRPAHCIVRNRILRRICRTPPYIVNTTVMDALSIPDALVCSSTNTNAKPSAAISFSSAVSEPTLSARLRQDDKRRIAAPFLPGLRVTAIYLSIKQHSSRRQPTRAEHATQLQLSPYSKVTAAGAVQAAVPRVLRRKLPRGLCVTPALSLCGLADISSSRDLTSLPPLPPLIPPTPRFASSKLARKRIQYARVKSQFFFH
jgi:hypothetical protein